MRLADKKIGNLTASEIFFFKLFLDSVVFTIDFSQSRCIALVAATAQTVLIIKKNGVQVGTITFAAAGTVGVFGGAPADVTCVAGDYLTIEGPAVPDVTLADIAATLFGERFL
ncbi:MAG: hypothetical protein ACE5F6_00280 [Anaerolineae bacterium]